MTEGEVIVVMLRTVGPCDIREFLRSFGFKDQVAEAGVTGVLNTCLLWPGGVGNATKEEDKTLGERTVDLPTYDLSDATIPGYSYPAVTPSPIVFHESSNCGTSDGEPIAEDDTEAPDSEDAERTGGCSWKEYEAEWGEPAGV